MISKENFIKYISKIKELYEIENAVNKAGRELELSISFAPYEQLVVEILSDAFNDTENDNIDYFIYELNYGSRWHEGCITTKDGKDIPMRNAEELYDILLDNLEN